MKNKMLIHSVFVALLFSSGSLFSGNTSSRKINPVVRIPSEAEVRRAMPVIEERKQEDSAILMTKAVTSGDCNCVRKLLQKNDSDRLRIIGILALRRSTGNITELARILVGNRDDLLKAQGTALFASKPCTVFTYFKRLGRSDIVVALLNPAYIESAGV